MDHGEGIVRDPQLQDHQAVAGNVLRMGDVEEWPRFAAAEILELRVAGDSHHCKFAGFLGGHVEGVSQGALIGPVFFRHALADDGYIAAVLVVLFGEFIILYCGIENRGPELDNDGEAWRQRKNLHPGDALLARMEEEGRQETLRPAATGTVAEGKADFYLRILVANLSGGRRR